MNKLSYVAILLALSVLPTVASAQVPTPQPDTLQGHRINPLPIVYVENVNATVTDHALSATFDAQNSEAGSVGNIVYDAQIIHALPKGDGNTLYADDPLVYDQFTPQQTPFDLSAGAKKSISFSYTLPNIPTGDYRLRVRLSTTNDRELSWNDIPITITSVGTDAYGVMDSMSIDVAATDPISNKTGTTWAPRSGPNVKSGSGIALQAVLSNPSKTSLSGVLAIATNRSLYSNEKQIINTGASVTVASGADKSLSIPITAQDVPGAYRVLVFLQNASTGQRISGIAEYRYVVQGVSATVVSSVLRDLPTAKDGVSTVDFTIAGSADRLQKIQGTLDVTLSDDNGIAGNVSNAFTIDGAIPLQGTASIPLQRDLCGTPSVTLVVHNTDGAVLDTLTNPYPARAIACKNATSSVQPVAPASHMNWTIIILSAVALIALVATFFSVRIFRKKPTIPLSLLIVVMATAGLLYSNVFTPFVHANGIQYISYIGNQGVAGQNSDPTLTVASPAHDSTVANGPIYYSSKYTWINCGNDPAAGVLQVYTPTVPGAYTDATFNTKSNFYTNNYVDPNAYQHNSATWTKLITNSYSRNKNCFRCDSRPRETVALSGNITPAGMAPGITTTLWTAGTNWGWIGAQLFDYTVVHVKPNPTPTPTPTPTPSTTPTATPTVSPTPTPSASPTPTVTPVSGNNPPVSVASISAGNGAFGSSITVEQGTPVSIKLSANGSSDPDGWTTPSKGVSQGGKCEWNSDLNQGTPTFETTIADPSSPAACQISLGTLTFNDAPGTYTYKLLRITDAAGAQSNNGTVSVTVVAKGSPTPTPNPTASASPSATPAFGSGNFQETR